MDNNLQNIIHKLLDRNYPINFLTKTIDISQNHNITQFIDNALGINSNFDMFYYWAINKLGKQFSTIDSIGEITQYHFDNNNNNILIEGSIIKYIQIYEYNFNKAYSIAINKITYAITQLSIIKPNKTKYFNSISNTIQIQTYNKGQFISEKIMHDTKQIKAFFNTMKSKFPQCKNLIDENEIYIKTINNLSSPKLYPNHYYT